MTGDRTQDEVRRFLADPSAHEGGEVDVIETHASVIFLTPGIALKMKKAIRYPYLDYSTLEKRRGFCEAEVEINRRTAPALYLGAVAVTRDADGKLAVDGGGEPVEWLVRMKRFDNDGLLDRVARRDGLSPRLCRDVADVIFDFHRETEAKPERDAAGDMAQVAEGNADEMRRHGGAVFDQDRVEALARRTGALIEEGRALLERRAADGRVRHVHGDLHLRNIVMLDGRPTPFDAIEFDPAICEIDVLYDLAFLLMDLLHRDHRVEANRILNRYLARGGDYGGVKLLPLFLSLRAGIRAHTTASAASSPDDREKIAEARAYLDLALDVLDSGAPLAVAVGGPSGSGKSTAAALLAPRLGGAAGAIHLRSDVVRKRLMGNRPEEKLPEEAYAPEVSRRVFATLAEEAGTVTAAGQSVVVDAVFGRASNVEPLKRAVAANGIRLSGFWLDADPEILRSRVGERTDDASDADKSVLEKQLGRLDCPAGWRTIDAGGAAEVTVEAICAALDA